MTWRMQPLTLISLLLVTTLSGCSKRDRANRARLTKDSAVAATSQGTQPEQQVAQTQAQQVNVNVEWLETLAPTRDESGEISVVNRFSYNSYNYETPSVHKVFDGDQVNSSSQLWDLGRDGISVRVNAGCSDSDCSLYAVTFNVYRNNQEVIQRLLWIDFASETEAPRVHSTSAGKFWSLESWFKFASDPENFK